MINRFYVQLSKTLSAKTIQNTHGVLYSALQAAVDRDVITRNPAARGIELPKVERPEMEVWTLDELKTFHSTRLRTGCTRRSSSLSAAV